MKHKVKIIILSVLGVLLVGSSVAYAYSQKGTLISQKTEELPDGNIYVEELYEIDQYAIPSVSVLLINSEFLTSLGKVVFRQGETMIIEVFDGERGD